MAPFPLNAPQQSSSLADTDHLAAALAKRLEPYDIVGLTGPLGAGKTTFVRGLVKALGGDGDQVSSPSFTLINEYHGTRIPVFHFDLYRFSNPSEFRAIGGDEYLDRGGIVCVEWPEHGAGFLPESRYTLAIEIVSAEERILTLTREVS